ncbi:hypothetical protein ACSCBZ_45895 [Streptomyces niveiscabiei]|uniref:hypothetical protein n=1 Tax=Streptomyces niveiscabiei TaxID=164115 RepID=UPI000A840186|nr:hypothetical protein [Streptomyces niveiscabiei]
MTGGRHRAPTSDGRTAGAVLLGSLAAGLALAGIEVSAALRAGAAPVGVSRPDALAPESADSHLTDRPAPHTDRYGTRPPVAPNSDGAGHLPTTR